MAKLTARQQAFCDEYLIDLNATQAAIRAGYSTKSAGNIASENMEKPEIRARIDAALAERSKRTGVNADRVVRELGRIAFINAPDVIDTLSATVKGDANEDDTAVIQAVRVKTVMSDNSSSVEREIKLADKVKALELLGKHLNMFNDKLDITAPVTIVIKDDYGD